MSLETGNEGFFKKTHLLYFLQVGLPPCLLIALYKFKCPETKVLMGCEPFQLKSVLHLSLDTYYLNFLIQETLEAEYFPISTNDFPQITLRINLFLLTLKPIYCCLLSFSCIILLGREVCLKFFLKFTIESLHKIQFLLTT